MVNVIGIFVEFHRGINSYILMYILLHWRR